MFGEPWSKHMEHNKISDHQRTYGTMSIYLGDIGVFVGARVPGNM